MKNFFSNNKNSEASLAEKTPDALFRLKIPHIHKNIITKIFII